MLKKITYTLCLLSVFVIVGNTKIFYSSQPPTGHAGSQGQYCTNCHGSFSLNSGGGSVSTTGLPTGSYVAGQTYDFSVTIAHGASDRNRWGFSIAARNSAGQPVGTFSSTNPNAALNGDELSHNNAVSVPNSSSYTYSNLRWTAPATPSAANHPVTFYYVGNATNGNFNPDGDYVYSGSSVVALPISLSGFSADVKGTAVTLKWQTLSENNSSHFVIEKSADNQHFYQVNKLSAAGVSSSTRTYSFVDDKPAYFEKPTYYRLVLIDKDGSKKYSNVVNVSLKAVSTFVKKLYPNPVRVGNVMQVEIISNKQQRTSIYLTNVSGNKVQQLSSSLEKGNNVIDISLNKSVAAGMYALVVRMEDGVQQIPVLIQ